MVLSPLSKKKTPCNCTRTVYGFLNPGGTLRSAKKIRKEGAKRLQPLRWGNVGLAVTPDTTSASSDTNENGVILWSVKSQGAAAAICPSVSAETWTEQEGANKGLGAGNPSLKSVSQSVSGVGGMMKTKRERSVSMDSGEQRDTITPVQEPDAKVEGVMRSKRRCVLEKKQPYSGDEWCSGPDTEEEEDKPHPATHRE
ncbi:B-cell CLL/lymphoma 9-like protein isoform X1 [Oncorhynchus clarkii lewisi]|uniref:B-cell CLL/lymphoma 9-like protein isoform X1 n=1 Tax=Oncorhynchus clarkii lewisi TaxID=490388 RepID=UPI0039B8D26F